MVTSIPITARKTLEFAVVGMRYQRRVPLLVRLSDNLLTDTRCNGVDLTIISLKNMCDEKQKRHFDTFLNRGQTFPPKKKQIVATLLQSVYLPRIRAFLATRWTNKKNSFH